MNSNVNFVYIIFGALLVSIIAGCLSNRNNSGGSTSASEYEQSMTFDGRTRNYLVHLSPGYNSSTKNYPLVIVLHGGGGNARNAERMTDFSEKADKEGFIAVYPEGTGKLERYALTWNAGNCCGYALDNNVDDVGFIRALIEKLEKDLRIDSNRIFATGISNGGMMSYRLACELSDKIAAIGPVAGALNMECKPAHPVSVIIFHGTADQHILYEGGPPKKIFDDHPRVDNSVAYAVSFWVKQNGCSNNSKKQDKGNISIETYTDDKNGTEVALYTIKDGGHVWPGGEKGGPWGDEPTQEISATDIIWDFFAKHPKKEG